MQESQQGNQNKKQRRSRKDMNQRNHICKFCGKGYLSHAALYTHVKNKHEQKKNKNEERVDISINEAQQKQIIKEQKKIHSKIAGQTITGERALQGLKNLMKKFFNERNKTSTLDQILQGISQEQSAIFKPLLVYWNEQTDPPTDKQSICINYVIAYFIHLMSKKVSPLCIQYLIKFFYHFRLGLIYQTRKNSICQNQSASQLPNHFNQIIMNGHLTQNYTSQELMSNSQIAKRVIEHFGNWMYDEKFTDYKTIPNY